MSEKIYYRKSFVENADIKHCEECGKPTEYIQICSEHDEFLCRDCLEKIYKTQDLDNAPTADIYSVFACLKDNDETVIPDGQNAAYTTGAYVGRAYKANFMY